MTIAIETPNAPVALIASSVCDNTASAIAGDQNLDMIGRPGLNPLPEDELAMGSLGFKLDDVTQQHTAPNKKGLRPNDCNIQEARRQADYVLVSVHSHKFAGTAPVNPAEFMRTYCKACIDAGADAILGHGPHIADDAVLHYLAELSAPFGTKLNIQDNMATIDL